MSTYRDYALLVPAAKDKSLANLTQKRLEEQSAESAGTNHPAILMLLPAPEGAGTTASMAHDEALEAWGAVVPLSLAVKGESAPVALPIQLILVGIAKN